MVNEQQSTSSRPWMLDLVLFVVVLLIAAHVFALLLRNSSHSHSEGRRTKALTIRFGEKEDISSDAEYDSIKTAHLGVGTGRCKGSLKFHYGNRLKVKNKVSLEA
ncbi:hypothetical protein Ddye_005096 [Dipteronia dyeriana]|uniref:Uncharacterized protein n=1 Tax=Dipteronia dyeriana TaxID=168575 RepID=A0AAD9XFP4_9ROSI|nr:hypothetical protein Ddye_005096 [Dipteronia dyeriana]